MEGRKRVRSSARLVAERRAAEVSGAAAAAERAAAEARAAAAAAERAARRARAAAREAEVEDSPRVLRDKCRRLARAIRNAKHLVVYTGAGVSTAAAIPDYRGPRGVWTRLRRGERAPRVDLCAARPTYTHRALAALAAAGRLRFLVSQNCDGLHLRAGTPRRLLAELHGNMFLERCAHCRRVYARAVDTTARTRRHRHGTRRLCHACGRELRDTIVHFGEVGRAAWPLNWAGALRHAAAADVVLCLGSSLKVLRRYPRLWSMHRPAHTRPRLYIVNLQWTPKDRCATLKINARCDEVMAAVARRLRLRVPRYSPRHDPLHAHATPLAPPERHTVPRPPPPPPRADSCSSSGSSRPASPSSPSSGSSWSSDSEDERPLHQLARRLRPAAASPPPAPPLPPPPPVPPAPAMPPLKAIDGLINQQVTSFQVNLRGGAATILLRSEHASVPADPALAPAPRSALRLYRKPRPRRPSELDDDERPLSELASSRREPPPAPAPAAAAAVKLEVDEEVAEMARRIMERALRLCRARLYPGLHCILPPSPPPSPRSPRSPPRSPDLKARVKHELRLDVKLEVKQEERAAECGWCWRWHDSRRCLWYLPRDPLAPRAWRRARSKRYLCACCPRDDAAPAPHPPAAAHDPAAHDPAPPQPGWYGKGYGKWRRKR